jgi:hypothetical protein
MPQRLKNLAVPLGHYMQASDFFRNTVLEIKSEFLDSPVKQNSWKNNNCRMGD